MEGDNVIYEYKTKKGQHFVVTINDKAKTHTIVGHGLSLKGAGDPQERGVTQKSPFFVANLDLNRSHLIPDEFKGSGFKDARNIISVSDHYNKKEMRRAEEDIYVEVQSASATRFSLSVSVTWGELVDKDGELIDEELIKQIAQQAWLTKEYVNTPVPEILKKEIKARHAASPKLMRCKRISYGLTITESSVPENVGKKPPIDPLGEDIWLLLEKKKKKK